MAELLWPDASNPRHSLSVALSQLRSATRGSGLDPVEADEARVSTRLECDAVQLTRAATDRDQERVAELYRGPFLAGVELEGNVELEEWLYEKRELLAARAQLALLELAEAALTNGNRRAAATLTERAASLQAEAGADDEALLGRLYRLLTATGNPRAQAVQEEATAFGISLVGGDASAPQAPGTTEHNLPPAIGTFFGREDELRDLARLLSEGERLVTIVGFGGNGKTRLSLALAHRLITSGEYDLIHFAPLEGLSEPNQLLANIVATLPPGQAQRDPLATLKRHFSAKRVLLILDDIARAAAAPRLLELLEACPALSVVVTSREPLGLPQERLFPLRGMPLPATAAEALRSRESYDGLMLYLHFAQRFDPWFALGPRNTAPILRVCQLVDGSPLGMELAASLARVIPVKELAKELESNLDLLVSTDRTLPPRHASLRAIFERTWRMLSEREQEALSACAVFSSGFTRGAASDVTGIDLSTLTALLERSLIRRQGERYDFHPVVLQYAREKLASRDDESAVRARHAEHFFALLRGKSRFDWNAGRRSELKELERDIANIRLAWEWAAANQRTDLLKPVIVFFARYLLTHGYRGVCAQLMELVHTKEGLDPQLCAWTMIAHARALRWHDPAQSLALLGRSLPLIVSHGSEVEVSHVYFHMAMAHLELGDREEARRHFLLALPALERHDDKELLPLCLARIGLTSTDGAEEDEWLWRALETSRRTGNMPEFVKISTFLAANLSRIMGEHTRALTLLEEAFTKERDEIGRPRMLAMLHCMMSLNHLNQGDVVAAEEHAGAATRLLEESEPGSEYLSSDGLLSNWALNHLHFARGDLAQAKEISTDSPPEYSAHELLAWIAIDEGDAATAEHHRRASMTSVRPAWPGRTLREYEVHSHLLRAEIVMLSRDWAPPDLEVESVPKEALRELLTALEMVSAHGFVPLALAAFNTAYALSPEVTGAHLPTLAALHPSSWYYIRRRARRLLAREPQKGLEPPGVPGAPRAEAAAGLTSQSLLALATELKHRLSEEHEGAPVRRRSYF